MVSVSPGFAQSTYRINLEQYNEIRIDIQMTVSMEMETLSGVVAISDMPLRSLFKGSELIVAGRVGKTIEIKKGDKEILLKTAFSIQSTLKGKARKKTLFVYQQRWGDEANFAGDGKEGDQMLLFLNMNEEFKGYEVNGYTYGAKKLSDSDLADHQRADRRAKRDDRPRCYECRGDSRVAGEMRRRPGDKMGRRIGIAQ